MTRPPHTSRHPDPRRLALNLLRQVEEGAYADLALDDTCRRNPDLDPRDRGLLTELVYGILRCRNRLDWRLRPLCRQPLERLEPGVLRLLRLGAYQILQLDRIPDSAAVDTSVRLAKQTGLARASGLVNAVLRNLVRQKEQRTWPEDNEPAAFLEHTCSLPGWLAKRWLRQYGAEKACALGRALMEPAPLTVRCNTLMQTPEAFANLCASLGLDFEPCRFAPEGFRFADRRLFDLLPANSFQVQDEASMLIAHLLRIQPGETVVDTCAAPGTKTTHLAALGKNRLELFAFDLHPARVDLIRRGAERLGCRGIRPEQHDMTQPPAAPKPQSCDAVLVDAPCSGLGVVRRNPETRWR
ncbi:MAG: 16S rRNA (cytosine(967)-C(5))-methyltransferase RsmB, partial [Deltaproteobacteria bacterium]